MLFDAQPAQHFYYRLSAHSSPVTLQLAELADGGTCVDLWNAMKRLSYYTLPGAEKPRLSLASGEVLKVLGPIGPTASQPTRRWRRCTTGTGRRFRSRRQE